MGNEEDDAADRNGSANLQLGRETALVIRTAVPVGLNYREYRPYLRQDFVYSCAYCTISEAEAQALRMTIDHYEPRKMRPDLVNEYENLLYACDQCNLLKGDRCPPDNARAEGHRFFRPDKDLRPAHFMTSGRRVTSTTNIGNFTIEALDLNRAALRRLRELRARLHDCEKFIAEGFIGLRRSRTDQLPPNIRARVVLAIRDASQLHEAIANRIDKILAEFAQSPLLDLEEDQAHDKQRADKLKQYEALFPGSWRAAGSPKKT